MPKIDNPDLCKTSIDKLGVMWYYNHVRRGSPPGPPSGKRGQDTPQSTKGHPLGREVKNSWPVVPRRGMGNQKNFKKALTNPDGSAIIKTEKRKGNEKNEKDL